MYPVGFGQVDICDLHFLNIFPACTDILKLDHDTALKMIDSVDKARNVYHRKYTGYLPSDMDHVDLMVNSALLGVDGTAEMIAYIAKQKFHLD